MIPFSVALVFCYAARCVEPFFSDFVLVSSASQAEWFKFAFSFYFKGKCNPFAWAVWILFVRRAD